MVDIVPATYLSIASGRVGLLESALCTLLQAVLGSRTVGSSQPGARSRASSTSSRLFHDIPSCPPTQSAGTHGTDSVPRQFSTSTTSFSILRARQAQSRAHGRKAETKIRAEWPNSPRRNCPPGVCLESLWGLLILSEVLESGVCLESVRSLSGSRRVVWPINIGPLGAHFGSKHVFLVGCGLLQEAAEDFQRRFGSQIVLVGASETDGLSRRLLAERLSNTEDCGDLETYTYMPYHLNVVAPLASRLSLSRFLARHRSGRNSEFDIGVCYDLQQWFHYEPTSTPPGRCCLKCTPRTPVWRV